MHHCIKTNLTQWINICYFYVYCAFALFALFYTFIQIHHRKASNPAKFAVFNLKVWFAFSYLLSSAS